MRSEIQGNKDIRFTLFDNPDFTGNANALCDYTITGTYDIDGGAINQPYTTIMANNDHNHTYDTGFNITGFTITSVVPVCPCVLVIFQFITPTPSVTQTMTSTPTSTSPLVTPTNTTTQTNTPSFTPTNTATPTMTPTTPEECPCNCWSLTYPSGEMPEGLEVRYRDCQLDTVQTQSILSLETIDNLDGTYTANICVQTGGTYNTPVCVSGSTEIICDPFSWVQGGVCCIPADCVIYYNYYFATQFLDCLQNSAPGQYVIRTTLSASSWICGTDDLAYQITGTASVIDWLNSSYPMDGDLLISSCSNSCA
jgi:hypothetical protein